MPTSRPLRPRCSHARRTAALLRGLVLPTALAVASGRAHAQAAPPSTAALPGETPEFAMRVDSVFNAWRGTDRPGCAVGVSLRGRVVLERAYGMADLQAGTPMTPTTVVHSASVAKQVTALAVLLLVRDGRLALDDDVRRHLPELTDYASRDGRPITVRHLLTHTSGLRDFFELLLLARGGVGEDRVADSAAMALVRRQRALNFAPGTEYGYNNTGYLLAARIVERVSGEPFAAFVASRIFAPLGMTHTRLRDRAAAGAGQAGSVRAVGYARDGAGWRTSIPDYEVVGPTNMETTVGDLLRLAANLDRPTVGDSALVRQMLTRTVLPTGDTLNYGMGLAIVRDRGLEVVEHEGRDPGFRAYLGRWPEPGLTVALLCNAAALNPVGLGRDVAGLAVGRPRDAAPAAAAAPATPPPAPSDPRRALAWAGVYLEPSTRQVAELTVRDSVLYTDRVGGARVEAIDARRARLVGVPLELEFGPGPRAGYRVRWLVPGRRVDTFEWRAPAAPVLDRAALGAYAGAYRSPELDAAYRIEAGDSTITLHVGERTAWVARPVFPDGFVSGQYTIQFARRGGRVTGFEISHPRARGVAFVRSESSR